jgi:hypothetical protein
MRRGGLLMGQAVKTTFERSPQSDPLRPSSSTHKQVVKVIDHEHVILSILSLAILSTGRTRGQRKSGGWSNGLRTFSLRYGHQDPLVYQPI